MKTKKKNVIPTLSFSVCSCRRCRLQEPVHCRVNHGKAMLQLLQRYMGTDLSRD
uniref:Uncharacterized protein n=1 Tax=Anguilla anguilla TaxID=7936 RepID=A0A0E9QT04_ANGAN